MNGWKKIDVKNMKNITGGGFWITVWMMSLATLVIGKSVISEKASVAINGMGRASWENKPQDSTNSVNNNKTSKKGSVLSDLETFYAKFYEV